MNKAPEMPNDQIMDGLNIRLGFLVRRAKSVHKTILLQIVSVRSKSHRAKEHSDLISVLTTSLICS